jgi:hypothetical protein
MLAPRHRGVWARQCRCHGLGTLLDLHDELHELCQTSEKLVPCMVLYSIAVEGTLDDFCRDRLRTSPSPPGRLRASPPWPTNTHT